MSVREFWNWYSDWCNSTALKILEGILDADIRLVVFFLACSFVYWIWPEKESENVEGL